MVVKRDRYAVVYVQAAGITADEVNVEGHHVAQLIEFLPHATGASTVDDAVGRLERQGFKVMARDCLFGLCGVMKVVRTSHPMDGTIIRSFVPLVSEEEATLRRRLEKDRYNVTKYAIERLRLTEKTTEALAG